MSKTLEATKALLTAQGIPFKVVRGQVIISTSTPKAKAPAVKVQATQEDVDTKSLMESLVSRKIAHIVKPNGDIEIKENFKYKGKNLKTLGRLAKVGGRLDLEGCSGLVSLGRLNEVGGNCTLRSTKITTTGQLLKVEGELDLRGIETLEDLGVLKSVGELYAVGCKNLLSLGPNLKKVIGCVSLGTGSGVLSLGALQSAGSINADGSMLEDTGDLVKVDGDADFQDTKLFSLGKLKSVKGDLTITGTGVSSLGCLEVLSGDLHARCCPLKDYGKLRFDKSNIDIYLQGMTFDLEYDGSADREDPLREKLPHSLFMYLTDTLTDLYKADPEKAAAVFLRPELKGSLPWNIARSVLEGHTT